MKLLLVQKIIYVKCYVNFGIDRKRILRGKNKLNRLLKSPKKTRKHCFYVSLSDKGHYNLSIAPFRFSIFMFFILRILHQPPAWGLWLAYVPLCRLRALEPIEHIVKLYYLDQYWWLPFKFSLFCMAFSLFFHQVLISLQVAPTNSL